MSKEAMTLALEALEGSTDKTLSIRAITALREALAEQPAQSDPCPGCRKGGVCRTPQCGRLKLPVDHPFRAEQSAQQDDSVVFGVDRAPAQKRPQNCGTGYCSCIECVMEPAQQQEPMARSKAYDMIDRFLQNNLNSDDDYAEYSKSLDSIYTSPPAQRKPLPDEQIVAKALHLSGLGTSPDVIQFARAIEAAHGIKENT